MKNGNLLVWDYGVILYATTELHIYSLYLILYADFNSDCCNHRMEVEASVNLKWRELATDTSAKHACPMPMQLQEWWPLIIA